MTGFTVFKFRTITCGAEKRLPCVGPGPIGLVGIELPGELPEDWLAMSVSNETEAN